MRKLVKGNFGYMYTEEMNLEARIERNKILAIIILSILLVATTTICIYHFAHCKP